MAMQLWPDPSSSLLCSMPWQQDQCNERVQQDWQKKGKRKEKEIRKPLLCSIKTPPEPRLQPADPSERAVRAAAAARQGQEHMHGRNRTHSPPPMDLGHCGAASCHHWGQEMEREGSREEQTQNSLARVFLHCSQQAPLIPSLDLNQPLSHSQEWIYKLLLPEQCFPHSCIQTHSRGKPHRPASCYSLSLRLSFPRGKM